MLCALPVTRILNTEFNFFFTPAATLVSNARARKVRYYRIPFRPDRIRPINSCFNDCPSLARLFFLFRRDPESYSNLQRRWHTRGTRESLQAKDSIASLSFATLRCLSDEFGVEKKREKKKIKEKVRRRKIRRDGRIRDSRIYRSERFDRVSFIRELSFRFLRIPRYLSDELGAPKKKEKIKDKEENKRREEGKFVAMFDSRDDGDRPVDICRVAMVEFEIRKFFEAKDSIACLSSSIFLSVSSE